LRSGLIIDTGTLSLAVLVVSVASPILVYLLVKRVGIGTLLFERPKWARVAKSDQMATSLGHISRWY
jgi:uncharacterized membrane protein YcfT